MSCNYPNFLKIASFALKLPWLERALNLLSIGGIMVSFRPFESLEMPFEVWKINENFSQNFDHFQKMELVLRVKEIYFLLILWDNLILLCYLLLTSHSRSCILFFRRFLESVVSLQRISMQKVSLVKTPWPIWVSRNHMMVVKRRLLLDTFESEQRVRYV